MSKGINPIIFADEVNDNFLNYQLTAFPFTDPELARQAKELIKGKKEEAIPNSLIHGPYISLSKSFLEGKTIKNLIESGKAHPALEGIAAYPSLYSHQEKAFEAISNNKHCLVSTGTGSGKTESFLLPIINYCLKLRDNNEPEGITAILVYPMNALATDQLERLREMLTGSGISFGIYVGSTPKDESAVNNIKRLIKNEGKKEYEIYKSDKLYEGQIISPSEERLTEKEIQENPPRILITNINQLEMLLTRESDIKLFMNAKLKFLVFDEAHTYSGAKGGEVACLIRRLKSICGKKHDEVICIGTSATMADSADNGNGVYKFASRFFGVNEKDVVLVGEEYREELFESVYNPPESVNEESLRILEEVIEAIDSDDEKVSGLFKELTSMDLTGEGNIREKIYDNLKRSSYVSKLVRELKEPEELEKVIIALNMKFKRNMNRDMQKLKAELLTYLALGAYAEKDGKPLLKPKVHYFAKGLEGVTVVFTENEEEKYQPELCMNRKEAKDKYKIENSAILPVMVCPNCGQHYFEGFYKNLKIEDNKITGGNAQNRTVYWEPGLDGEEADRVILTNRFYFDDENEDLSRTESEKYENIYFCHYCGTLHRNQGECLNPKCRRQDALVEMYIMKNVNESKLETCTSCGHKGRKQNGIVKNEAIRTLSATTVSDVHILAQNMINSAHEGNKKLIIFADNRQEAAFQAGWMTDHTRRYRFRHLLFEYLKNKREGQITSIGDIVEYLINLMRENKNLSKILAPEVYEQVEFESYSTRLDEELEFYWRSMVLREIGTSFKKRECLESWGCIQVIYSQINQENEWIKEKASELDMKPEELSEGINILLDKLRRDIIIYDEKTKLFSTKWVEGSKKVQSGMIPLLEYPRGLKYAKEEKGNSNGIKYFISLKRNSSVEVFLKKWNITKDKFDNFLNELWRYLTTEAKILKKVDLTWENGNIYSSGVYQIDTSRIGIKYHNKKYVCSLCKRVHTRNTPERCCTNSRCNGKLEALLPDEEDYNISMLNKPFSMVIAREHTAQIPNETREKIEQSFKEENGDVNCLVATSTLEMGVNIGALDMVLMRNVPPKSANYWQRAGRAGRKHRMAVIYTYCKKSEHDKYFFDKPEEMLNGKIEPPRFNMKNEIMIRKHIHAAVLSELIKLRTGNTSGTTLEEAGEINEILGYIFPTFIKTYLYKDDTYYRENPYDISKLRFIIDKQREKLITVLKSIFEIWPEEDKVSVDILEKYLNEMTDKLDEVIKRLFKRMRWAVDTKNRLSLINDRDLDKEEKRLLRRCESYLNKIKSVSLETYTLSVLSSEGFLPGYGTGGNGIVALVSSGYNTMPSRKDFELTRPGTAAVREFVPGNMIYANSSRFKVSYYNFPAQKERIEPDSYKIDLNRNIITKVGENQIGFSYLEPLESADIKGLPISDLNITYVSRISDEEANRFQLPVALMGYLNKYHNGIKTYTIGKNKMQHRFGQEMRLVNIGPAERAKSGKLGYYICTVCGAAVSPLSSEMEIDNFKTRHQKKCGKLPESIALSNDIKVDGFLFPDIEKNEMAVNLGEALKIGAVLTIEMEKDDLDYIVFPTNNGLFDLFVYDSMPGGSGLLQQMIDNWEEMIDKAELYLSNCTNDCEKACYSCMKEYGNIFVHSILDRYFAKDIIDNYRNKPLFETDLPAVVSQNDVYKPSEGTNKGEITLKEILEKEGFPEFEEQKKIKLNSAISHTIPDLYYEDNVEDIKIAIYLDGLSKGIHGTEEKQRIDKFIRTSLEESLGIEVVEIAHSELNDPVSLNGKLKRIAKLLRNKELRNKYN